MPLRSSVSSLFRRCWCATRIPPAWALENGACGWGSAFAAFLFSMDLEQFDEALDTEFGEGDDAFVV